MNYVPATHQSRRQNTEDRKQNVEYRIILNSEFSILFDSTSFLQEPEKLHIFHSSEDQNQQTQVNTGPSVINPVYTKSTAFTSRKIPRGYPYFSMRLCKCVTCLPKLTDSLKRLFCKVNPNRCKHLLSKGLYKFHQKSEKTKCRNISEDPSSGEPKCAKVPTCGNNEFSVARTIFL